MRTSVLLSFKTNIFHEFTFPHPLFILRLIVAMCIIDLQVVIMIVFLLIYDCKGKKNLEFSIDLS